MKNVAVATLIVGLVGSVASAGTVSMNAENLVVEQGAVVELELVVTEAAGSFDALNIIAGSDTLAVTNFTPNVAGVTTFFTDSRADATAYASGWLFGYFGTPSATPNDQMLGTLTVDTTGVELGEHVGLAGGVGGRDVGAGSAAGGGEGADERGEGALHGRRRMQSRRESQAAP